MKEIPKANTRIDEFIKKEVLAVRKAIEAEIPYEDMKEYKEIIDYQIQTFLDTRRAEILAMKWLKENQDVNKICYFNSGEDIIPNEILPPKFILNLSLRFEDKSGVKCISTHENAPIKSESLDTAIVDFGLLDNNKRDLVLKEIFRVLKPDGFIIFQKDFMPDGHDDELYKIKKFKSEYGGKFNEVSNLQHNGKAVTVRYFTLHK